jgi:hypothetical protein
VDKDVGKARVREAASGSQAMSFGESAEVVRIHVKQHEYFER